MFRLDFWSPTAARKKSQSRPGNFLETNPMTVANIKSGVGPGWHPIVDRLVADLLKLGWDGKVRQVKEKLGGLRFYIEQTMDALHDRIDTARAESYRTCETCGKPGLPRSNGWIKRFATNMPTVDPSGDSLADFLVCQV
jgi:hypothetical protein